MAVDRAILALHVCGLDRLWDEVPDAVAEALSVLDATIEGAILGEGEERGVEIVRVTDRTLLLGVAGVDRALALALRLQPALDVAPWPEALAAHPAARPLHGVSGEPIAAGLRVQVALHWGPPVRRVAIGGDLVLDGPAVRTAVARARGAPVGGVWVSESAWQRLSDPPQGACAGPDGDRFVPRRPDRDAIAAALPRYADRFVGRADALGALSAHADAGARSIAIVGPPGAGKTRLAVQWARSQPTVRFLDARAARTLEDLCALAADQLQIAPAGALDLAAVVARIGQALAHRGALWLVFDNLEQLPEGAGALIGEWIAAAPQIGVLTTSRRPIGVPRTRTVAIGALSPADGVALFRDRASGTPAGADAIASLVEAVDGLPLAIELAAGRTDRCTVPEITARLAERRFGVLRRAPGSEGDRPPHDTLFAALSWSQDLLAPAERAMLAALGTFAGPFRFADVAAVAPPERDPDAPDAADRLEALVRHSLVAERAGRYRLLQSVRAFARIHLDQRDDAPRIWRAHAEWITRLPPPEGEGPAAAARAAEIAEVRADLFEVVDRYAATAPDLAAAAALLLRTTTAAQPVDRQVALTARWSEIAAADRVVRARLQIMYGDALQDAGRLDDACAHHERAATLAPDDPVIEAMVRTRRGTHAFMHRDYARAEAQWSAARDLNRSAGRDAHVAWNLSGLGRIAAQRDELSQSEALLEEALQLARRCEDWAAEGNVQLQRTVLLRRRARPSEAVLAAEAASRLGTKCERADIVAFASVYRGAALLEALDPDAARSALLQALTAVRTAGMRSAELLACQWLARVAHASGQLREALSWSAAASALDESGPSSVDLTCRGKVLCELGDLQAADASLAAAFEISIALAKAADTAEIEVWQALTAARSNHPDRAAVLLASARRRSDASRSLIALGEAAIAIARARQADPSEAAAWVRRARDHLPDAPLDATAIAPDRFVRAQIRDAALPQADALVVDEHDQTVHLPDGRVVDLSRRGPPWRILRCLARRRIAAPGKGQPVASLIAEAWPGESLLPESGTNRAYVAVATLRKAGLRDLLVRSDDGYLLRPEVEVVVRG